jgi:CheY-like chemotaxis protein
MTVQQASEKNISIEVSAESGTPENIVTDSTHLTQVIMNLIGNSIKFTPDGGRISLKVRSLGEDGGRYHLEFAVSDTGVGIDISQAKRLFEPFEQADNSTTRNYGGTGLGLAITNMLVKMMGGDISVDSAPGEGSTFTFDIYADMPGEARGAEAAGSDSDAGSLGLVTGSGVGANANLGAGAGTAAGADAGAGAPARAAAGAGDTDFIAGSCSEAAVNTDDGAGAATGAGSGGGANDADCMGGLISGDMSGAAVGADGDGEGRASLCEGMIFLIVDDNDINRIIAEDALRGFGADIEFAENGSEAVDKFLADPKRYDAIFMDIMMPVMDGYEATRQIRVSKMRGAKEIPIIAMTANVFAEDIEKSKAAGMNSHIGKPLDLNQIEQEIRRFVLY